MNLERQRLNRLFLYIAEDDQFDLNLTFRMGSISLSITDVACVVNNEKPDLQHCDHIGQQHWKCVVLSPCSFICHSLCPEYGDPLILSLSLQNVLKARNANLESQLLSNFSCVYAQGCVGIFPCMVNYFCACSPSFPLDLIFDFFNFMITSQCYVDMLIYFYSGSSGLLIFIHFGIKVKK